MAGPLSVEDILAKQKADKEAASKFLTKADRARIALEKRNAEVAEQQAKDEEEKQSRIEFERAAEEERRRAEAERYDQQHHRGGYDRYSQHGQGQGQGQNGYGHGHGRGGWHGNQGYRNNGPGGPGGYNNAPSDGPRGAPTGPRGNGPPAGPRSMMQNGANGGPSTSSPRAGPSSAPNGGAPKPPGPGDVAMPSDAEMSNIRQRYLGGKQDRKKQMIRKATDKKAIFEWKAEDDTTATEQGTWRMEVLSQTANAATAALALRERNGHDDGRAGKEGTPSSVEGFADPLERRRAGKGNNDERHWSDKPLDEMKDRDWRIFREDFSISARGGSIPFPLRTWRESTIPAKILDVIDEIGYTEPSPIQRQAIPIGMQNRDLIGVAKTGSGKTAAFVIPMLDYIGHLPAFNDDIRHLGPYALILAPTRELAQQIESETAKFAVPMGLTCVSIIGGRSVEEQQFALRNGAEIIIATPGRLKDMIDKTMLVMSQCRYVVMDEADRMVDLGFEHDLNFILDSMPASLLKPDDNEILTGGSVWKGWRVTTLFSATMPPAVERLARKYLRKPATVTIGVAGEAVDTVEQRVEFVTSDDKRKNRLIELLRTIGLPPPMIVFVNQKKTADMVVKYVHQAGFSATTLHSDKSQSQRELALQELRDGTVAVLVATDIAGRGIDVPDVSCVINYQMSDTIEKYIHRIGRTGRAGKTGVAITFISNDDDEVMFELKQEIQKSARSTMNPELARHEAAKQKVTREMKRKREEDGE